MKQDNPKQVAISRKSRGGYSHYSKSSLTFKSFLFLADYMDKLKFYGMVTRGMEQRNGPLGKPVYPTIHIHTVFHSSETQSMEFSNTQDSCVHWDFLQITHR